MSNPVWMEHLVCAWCQTCSIGLGQILEALKAVWIMKLPSARWDHRLYLLLTTQLLPALAQLVPRAGGNGFLGKLVGIVNCLPSSDCWDAPSPESLPTLESSQALGRPGAGIEWMTFPWPSLLSVGPPPAPNAFTLHSELFVLSLYFGSTFLPSLYMFSICQYSLWLWSPKM